MLDLASWLTSLLSVTAVTTVVVVVFVCFFFFFSSGPRWRQRPYRHCVPFLDREAGAATAFVKTPLVPVDE